MRFIQRRLAVFSGFGERVGTTEGVVMSRQGHLKIAQRFIAGCGRVARLSPVGTEEKRWIASFMAGASVVPDGTCLLPPVGPSDESLGYGLPPSRLKAERYSAGLDRGPWPR